LRRDLQPELLALCERLVAATDEANVEWNVAEPNAFVCIRRSGSILVRSVDGSGAAPFELAIFNTDGLKVESVISGAAADEGNSSWNGAVASLYTTARHSALDDELVGDIPADVPPSGSPGWMHGH
jgi:hypothetical protein